MTIPPIKNIMRPMVIISLLTFASSLNLSGQDETQAGTKSYEDNEHHHEHHKNEIGVANSLVYFMKEKVFSYGLHGHYTYNIPKTKFGVGAGYERIFDEHKHNTLGVVASYRPVEKLSFNLSPGITWEGTDTFNPKFALHVETSYEFEIKDFHLGPTLEFAYDPEDYHLSFGLHIGFGF